MAGKVGIMIGSVSFIHVTHSGSLVFLRILCNCIPQQIQACACTGTDKYTGNSTILIPFQTGFETGKINLVPDQQLRHVFSPDFLQNQIDLFDLFLSHRIGGIDNMQEQIGMDGFFQVALNAATS